MKDDTIDFFADVYEVNEILKQCNTKFIEVKFDPQAMKCPVLGCKGIMFPCKTKFNRHWEEKHLLQPTKYICPLTGCLAECRRKSDMKAHVREKHGRDPQCLETILQKCSYSKRGMPVGC